MRRFTAAALILAMGLSTLAGCQDAEEKPSVDALIQAAIMDEYNSIIQIPKENGDEKAISQYLRSWSKDNGLEGIRDSSGNVIINLPASAGYENAPLTIIQSNMYSGESIESDSGAILTGTAIDTGNAMGMATALSIMKNAEKHGPVRAIFTTDGEGKMTGAEKLNEKYLEGNYLINLNWDDPETIGIGSGGTASYFMKHASQWAQPQNAIPYVLSIFGLNGGDADKDIGEGGANAIKIIGEILANAQGKGILFELASISGGTSADTIPKEASAVIVINESDVKKMQENVDDAMEAFQDAYGAVEQNYNYIYQETMMPEKVVTFEDNGSIISFIYCIINGVQSMSESYQGVVESASNLGMISASGDSLVCQVSAASTSDLGLYRITSEHEDISAISGFEYAGYDGIPRWPDHTDSVLFTSMQTIYDELYGEKPDGAIVHHELEIGWFVKKNPRLQVVSIATETENDVHFEDAADTGSITKPANMILKFLEQQTGKQ